MLVIVMGSIAPFGSRGSRGGRGNRGSRSRKDSRGSRGSRGNRGNRSRKGSMGSSRRRPLIESSSKVFSDTIYNDMNKLITKLLIL